MRQEHKPLVSVVIPTFNRARLLKEAIDSVYAQEAVGEQFEMEVIVIDDASPDDTGSVVRQYPAVRYLRLPENRGEGGARNAGIRACEGKYVAFLDDDDIWLPHRLKVQVPVLEGQPEVGLVYGQGFVTTDGIISKRLWPDARWGLSGRVFEALLTQDTSDGFNIDTLLVRREAFDKAGYFDENLATMEHYDMFLRLAFHFPVVFIPGPVCFGRYSPDGLWYTSVLRGDYKTAYPFIIERALSMLPDTQEYSQLRCKARATVFSIITKLLWRTTDVDHVRAYILASLRQYPWLLEEESAIRQMRRIADALASTKEAALPAVRAFWEEVSTAAGAQGRRARHRMRRLSADLFVQAAVALWLKGSFNSAVRAAARALIYDPTWIGRRDLVGYLDRGLRRVLTRSRQP